MKEQFKQFSENIRLTETQENEAKTKYDGICEKLHSSYYNSEYDGSTKFLFGSYKTKTNVRPLTEKQDVDVLFKIPKDTYEKFKAYENNGQSALLQEIKECLKEKYTTTDKIRAWGKVVLVEFAENKHNVEVLPAYENENKTFTIPNSENGGSWDPFDPRTQIEDFYDSNNSTEGLTAELTRMIKKWVNNTSSCDYTSYNLLSDVMKFLEYNFRAGTDYSEYPVVVKNFFQFLKSNCNRGIDSHIQTALYRATKACNFENEGKPKEASEEWRKIFGTEFPKVESNPITSTHNETRIFTAPSAPYTAKQDEKMESIELSDEDIAFLQDRYPSLSYDLEKNVITGTLKFNLQYKGLEPIIDEYRIEINLNKIKNGVPVVREIENRILDIAKQKGIPSNDLHLDNTSGEMCIIIPPKAKEKYPNGFDLKMLLLHLEEHLYWISYFEKYDKEPWKAYGHGEKGYLELYLEDTRKYSAAFKERFDCCTRPEVRRKVRALKKEYKI